MNQFARLALPILRLFTSAQKNPLVEYEVSEDVGCLDLIEMLLIAFGTMIAMKAKRYLKRCPLLGSGFESFQITVSTNARRLKISRSRISSSALCYAAAGSLTLVRLAEAERHERLLKPTGPHYRKPTCCQTTLTLSHTQLPNKVWYTLVVR